MLFGPTFRRRSTRVTVSGGEGLDYSTLFTRARFTPKLPFSSRVNVVTICVSNSRPFDRLNVDRCSVNSGIPIRRIRIFRVSRCPVPGGEIPRARETYFQTHPNVPVSIYVFTPSRVSAGFLVSIPRAFAHPRPVTYTGPVRVRATRYRNRCFTTVNEWKPSVERVYRYRSPRTALTNSPRPKFASRTYFYRETRYTPVSILFAIVFRSLRRDPTWSRIVLGPLPTEFRRFFFRYSYRRVNKSRLYGTYYDLTRQRI